MKTITSILLLIATVTFAQQKESFDIATYVVPKGGKIISNNADAIAYVITNNLKGTYCQMAIYKSMATMGNSQLDFETDWYDLVVKQYNVTAKSETLPATSSEGWEAKSGVASFEFSGGQSTAKLVTISGYGKRVSIVILSNTEDYRTEIKDFLTSIDLKKPEILPATQASNPLQVADNSSDVTSILGTWVVSSSDQSSWRVQNGVMSTIKRQYTFNADGTYSFVSKTFDPLMDKLLLGRESGTYQVSGNNLTVVPQKSAIEAWSKKDGTDKWGAQLNSQSNVLEKVTYQFTKHYFSGIQVWSLVLQAATPTQRDGSFSGGTAFVNSWLYSPIAPNNPVIELPR